MRAMLNNAIKGDYNAENDPSVRGAVETTLGWNRYVPDYTQFKACRL